MNVCNLCEMFFCFFYDVCIFSKWPVCSIVWFRFYFWRFCVILSFSVDLSVWCLWMACSQSCWCCCYRSVWSIMSMSLWSWRVRVRLSSAAAALPHRKPRSFDCCRNAPANSPVPWVSTQLPLGPVHFLCH